LNIFSITIGKALQIVVCALPIVLLPLCCANTIGPVIRTPPIGEAQRIKKIRENFLFVLRIRPASPIGAANISRFAYKCQMPSSANILAVAAILLALCCLHRFTFSSRTRLEFGQY
jgi:hypothetical protein